MTSFREVAKDVFVLDTPFCRDLGEYYVSIVLVRGADREHTCLIDSGESDASIDEFVLPALKGLGLDARDVGVLLCTHSHGDHACGHSRMKAVSGCRIGLQESAQASLARDGVSADFTVEDGDLVCGRLRAVFAPGHSRDCVCWLDESTGALITGDSFQARGTFGCGLALLTDTKKYFESAARVRKIRPARIVAGHAFRPFEAVVNGKNADAFFDEAILTAGKYLGSIEAFSRCGLTADEILSRLIPLYGLHYEKYICSGISTVKAILAEI